MSTLLSPITRRRIAAVSLALFPISAWMTAATYGSGMAWRDWNGRAVWYFVKQTPGYPLLYGALGIGLLIALALILYVSRTAKTQGFEGAAYKRFVRGTRMTTAKHLAKLCTESGQQQIDVAGS